jgi:hypothetical protein
MPTVSHDAMLNSQDEANRRKAFSIHMAYNRGSTVYKSSY